ncbi:MAG: RIP metalloprotease RseP [Bacillota bacterium]
MNTFLAAVVIFGLLILVHELGHFLVAKATGVAVHEFSLGFGPRLGGFKRGETAYNIRAFPLGGFVRMAGMEPREEEVPPEKSFKHKPLWARMAIILAGPLMNFVLAVVILAAVFYVQGLPTATTRIQEVLPGEPAARAGLQKGDTIIALNGVRVASWEKMVEQISARPGREVILTVLRDGRPREIRVVPARDPEGRGRIGVLPVVELKRVGVEAALAGGADYTARLTWLIVDFIGKMITHQAPVDVGGPVRVVAEIGKVAGMGLVPLLNLAAFLSINLGLFNLLPIPALDGSRFLFLTWEGISGRPIKPERENMIHLIGFALLLVLMVVITYNDILRLLYE